MQHAEFRRLFGANPKRTEPELRSCEVISMPLASAMACASVSELMPAGLKNSVVASSAAAASSAVLWRQ